MLLPASTGRILFFSIDLSPLILTKKPVCTLSAIHGHLIRCTISAAKHTRAFYHFNNALYTISFMESYVKQFLKTFLELFSYFLFFIFYFSLQNLRLQLSKVNDII